MMSSLQHVNPSVRGIRESPHSYLQSLAAHITQEITQGAQKPFREVIHVSSGDPHRAGMKPISFVRQVLAVCLHPELLEDTTLPLDVRLRAQGLLEVCDGGSVGSYTASSGMPHVKQRIAEFIMRRDAGVPSFAKDIFISAGSQKALMVVVRLLANGEGETQTGVLTPMPCPHTLPPLLDAAGVALVPYRLMEDRGWAVDLDELRRALKTSRRRCDPRAIYISNPGNPTGHVQDWKSIEEVIQFAAAERLLLLVDEVYQDSVYGQGKEFISYKRVLFEMGKEYSDTVELVSFHSVSSACMGECGLRAGYMEVVNMDPEVMHFVDTLLCTDISTPVTGQLALELMVNPPRPGDPSYDTFTQEILVPRAILSQNAQRVQEVLKDLPGMSCQPATGGIYLYPRLRLPSEIMEQAETLQVEADVLYCRMLLEQEGVFLGAGGRCGETTGNHHVRLCILVPPDTLEEVLARLGSFHLRLLARRLPTRLAGLCVELLISQSEMSLVQDVNPTVRGIRAPTVLQGLAARITEEITQGVEKPFQQVIDVSSGDPHRAGTAPMSFVRQVLAACLYPELLEEESLPLDARRRAQTLLGACGGSVGSYSATSRGIPLVQKSIAEFIMRRDAGVGSNPEDIICSSGSQKTLSLVLHLMASGEGVTRTGVLTPMPCPHTLPALLEMSAMTLVPYQLMEDRGWAVDLDELHRALKAARGRCDPRAIYISNPGNPTGHVQDRKSIEEVIRFAATEGLVLLAEEVYQDSVYGQEKEFVSYKRVLFEMGKEYSDTVELVSFHSLSSACMGECGLRGGYMEVVNMDPAVNKYLRNMQGTSSPPVLPQLALEVMVNPPTPGDASYKTYSQEILHSHTTLSQNAQRACEFLNDLPGMNCQPGMGGVFLYPCLRLPPQMLEEAKTSGVEADVLYCQRLLEEEGVCLGAGCENGQEDSNYHIRLCVLAPPATLEEILARLCSFHLRLLDTFP